MTCPSYRDLLAGPAGVSNVGATGSADEDTPAGSVDGLRLVDEGDR